MVEVIKFYYNNKRQIDRIEFYNRSACEQLLAAILTGSARRACLCQNIL